MPTISELSVMIHDLGSRLDKMEEKINNRVTYKHFWTIVGMLVTILLTVQGLIYAEIKDIRDDTTITKQDVATIKGRLEPYSIEFTK